MYSRKKATENKIISVEKNESNCFVRSGKKLTVIVTNTDKDTKTRNSKKNHTKSERGGEVKEKQKFIIFLNFPIE